MDDETEPEHGTPEWCRSALSHHMTDGLCSSCLIDQIVAGWKNRDLDFTAIANEIALLEAHPNARRTSTKPAAPFKKGRLKGFRHKHYFQASFVLRNIGDHWFDVNRQSTPKLDKLIHRTISDPSIPAHLKTNYILDRFVIGGLENRSREGVLAGEWIIYKRHDRVNYYLTLATHTEPEDRIVERFKSCAAEFPELASSLDAM